MYLAVRLPQFQRPIPLSLLIAYPDLWWEGAYGPDEADRVDASLPIWLNEQLHKRITLEIAEADKYVPSFYPLPPS